MGLTHELHLKLYFLSTGEAIGIPSVAVKCVDTVSYTHLALRRKKRRIYDEEAAFLQLLLRVVKLREIIRIARDLSGKI